MRLGLGLGLSRVGGGARRKPGQLTGIVRGLAALSATFVYAGGVSGLSTLTGNLTGGSGPTVALAMDMSDFRNTYILLL